MSEQNPLPDLDETVAAARERLFIEAQNGGTICPCCDQRAQVYRRTINATMARQLITAWRSVRDNPGQWFHLGRAVGYAGGDIAKVKHWDLLEEATEVTRADGGRAGYWRFTELGAAWVQGLALVRRDAYVYANRLIKVDGPHQTIQQRLGKKFDLRELLAPAPIPDQDQP